MQHTYMELLINANTKNGQVNENGRKGSIMFRSILMLRAKILIYHIIQTSLHHLNFVVHTKKHMLSEG